MATQHDDERADRIERDIAAALPDGVTPDCALAAVMSAVTRRMSRGEARRVVAAMPERHRAFLTAVADERDEAAEPLGRAAILRGIETQLGVDGAEEIAHAVLGAVGRALPQGLLHGALSQLPPEVASLWRTRVEGPVAGPVTSAPRPLVTAGVPLDTELDHPLLRRLEEMRAVPPRYTAASTFSVVGCQLARRLPRGEARRLVEALPEPLRPLFDPCMAARDEEPEPYGREDFLERLSVQLDLDRSNAELVARAVFRCLRDQLGAHDARDVESQLPEGLAEIWRLDQTRLSDEQRDEKPRRVAERAARHGTSR